jgi:DNA-directed RNA polymerase subunit RPC12/RpoP
MADLKRWDTQTLIKCNNAWCGEVSFRYDFEKNGWKCPHCGKRISLIPVRMHQDFLTRIDALRWI